MSWRNFLYLCLLAFVVTLAAMIGWRLADQAIAVIIGVLAGAVASIPTSLIVVWLVLRSRGLLAADAEAAAAAIPANPPQVIYVHTTPAPPTPPAAQRSLTVLPAYAAPEPTLYHGPRHFTLLGEDNDDI